MIHDSIEFEKRLPNIKNEKERKRFEIHHKDHEFYPMLSIVCVVYGINIFQAFISASLKEIDTEK